MAILERKIIHERTTLCSRIVYPNFVLPRHKHAEYEIMLFTHGNGKQFVGEGVRNYKEGDVVMIGSNVPLHIPADTRSAFPVISVQSPVSIQCCWQS